MKTLLETIKSAKNKFKTDGISPILYKLYENGKLVYVGIGGCKGNRKGYLRLQEHYKATMPSSLKWKILKIKWKEGLSFENAEKYWNFLSWEFENGTSEYITNKEKELIRMYNPKYNIEFKPK